MVLRVTVLYDLGASTIKRNPDNTVVKFGGKVRRESEVAVLGLTAQLRLPSSRVLEVTEGAPNREVQIPMTYIEGDTLGSIWPTLSTEEKRDICQQPWNYVRYWTRCGRPNDQLQQCNGGPVMDTQFYGIKMGGPFTNEEDLDKFIMDIHDMIPQPAKDTLAKHQRTGHRIVFAHGDLHQDNILVKDGKITGLIDWELAGWYPEYWDYITFCYMTDDHRDWKDHTEDVFSQTYDEELLFFTALSRFQRGCS